MCACGTHYDHDTLVKQQEPGYWRQWVNALGCTCAVPTHASDVEWRIDHYADEKTVLTTSHQCRFGGVGTLPSNN